MNFYNCIEQTGKAEFKDRGSKFLAYAFPFQEINQLKEILKSLKKEHPKANHFCFAYKIGNDNLIYRNSDDGEPAGSAGKPILGQLTSKNVTNTLIVVVRYFGGTLLGVPGLINAYKTASSMVLQVTPIVQKPISKLYVLEFNYTQLNEVMQVVNQFNCTVIAQSHQLFCQLTLGIPVDRVDNVLFKLKEMHNVEVLEKL
jgi:uncharacterized YigZ family protein